MNSELRKTMHGTRIEQIERMKTDFNKLKGG
jgi:hypothetical protein